MNIKKIIKKFLPYGFVQLWQNRSQNYSEFYNQFKFFQKNSEGGRFKCSKDELFPCLNDATAMTGFDRHYVYHPAWVARIIKKINPRKHIDISSSLHFISMLSAFIPVDFYDYRPANLNLSNLSVGHTDLLNLHFESDSIESLSCMHTVEHIGLGRYGDPIDYDGDLKAMKELVRVLKPGGNFYFVIPVGNEDIIQFNAHRIYTRDTIIKIFNELKLSLVEFCLIPENGEDGGLVVNPDDNLLNRQKYGCGCFWFKK